MMAETILANARAVTPVEVVDRGTVVLRDGLIAAIERGAGALAGAIDCGGDLLLPGLVELHTDSLEKHLTPRPGVRWPAQQAVLAHDAQLASAGITTVLDALYVGDSAKDGVRAQLLDESIDTIGRLNAAGLTRAEHWLHLRCEVASPGSAPLFERLCGHPLVRPLVRLVSVMDHTPFQRQWSDEAIYRQWTASRLGLDDAGVDRHIAERLAEHDQYAVPNRRTIVALAQRHALPLASHDDTTEAHVLEGAETGVTISEFPTSEAAARAARGRGMAIIMGAPNVVRGGSHSGNVSAASLAQAGLLDILSSDYVPSSLLHAAFLLEQRLKLPLERAVDMVAAAPARAVGLDDRGVLAPGKRADVVRVHALPDGPVVRAVWRRGERVI
jgi:alpha-D-ribose 1-methylphosphonate 5-triphosphate diphosphatase